LALRVWISMNAGVGIGLRPRQVVYQVHAGHLRRPPPHHGELILNQIISEKYASDLLH
jgi:hypothetical protein